MNFDALAAQIARGISDIWNGGSPTRLAFVLGAVLSVGALELLFKLAEIVWRSLRRRRHPESFLASGTEMAHTISVSTAYLESTRDALSKMRTGEQIALETTGVLKQVVRGKLQRRTSFLKNELGVSKSAFEELTGQQWIEGTPRVEVSLTVRPGYSLWSHPDDAIRISTRVTFWVTLFNVAVSLAVGWFFWWLRH